MAKRNILIALCLLFLSFFTAYSQEQLGVRLENYAGANGTTLNPTHSLDYPLRWNLNLVGMGYFVDNSYGYISNSTLFSLIKNEKEIEFGPELKGNVPTDAPILDFYKNKKSAYFIQNLVVNGPALSIKIGENHVGGLFYNVRFGTTVTKIPNSLKYYTLNSKGYNENFAINKFGGAVMAWDEIGANYAFRKETNNGFWELGTNLKFLRGKEGVFAKVNDDFEIARLYNDSLKIALPTVSFGFTNSNFDNINNGGSYQLQNLGKGFGIDLGFTYLVENNDYDDYWMRFGASILDIGQIKFNKKSEEHLIEFQNTNILDVNAFKKIDNPTDAVKLMSYQLKGDSAKTKVGNYFAIGLPTALCLQADYQVFPHAFANATLIQRVPYQAVGIRRGNLLAVSARYEHRWFSATLPIQLYEYQRVRLGFAARIAFLTVGTDYLGSLIHKGNFTGTDLYFAIKVNPLGLHLDRPNWFSGGFKKRGKKVECYKF